MLLKFCNLQTINCLRKMNSHSNRYQHDDTLVIYRNLNHWLNYLMGVTILVYFFGVLTFGEKFSFRDHAFSYFGRITTPNGNSNTLCFLMFVMGILLSAWICFRISHIMEHSRSHWLFWLAGVGYVVMLIPCDLYNPGHMIGAALLFFSLWLFSTLHLLRLRTFSGWLKFIFYQLVLQGTVLSYAYLYFIDSPEKQIIQKIAIAGLVLVLKLTAMEMLQRAEELSYSTGFEADAQHIDR